MELILASASPRRADLMAQVGWKFKVKPVDVNEELEAGLPVSEAVMGLALRKARASKAEEGLVIGADTVVVLDDRILGKPSSASDAREMLTALSGREHTVITGVALVNAASGEFWVGAEKTRVGFRTLSMEEIDAYIDSGEPMDKAGGYGIQGKGALLVRGIKGCYFNVVGLPLARLAAMLKEANFDSRDIQLR